jgi:DNA modification methylase
LAWSNPDDLILDLYAGHGSVARAAHATGRRYIGAEIDVDRHRAACARLANHRIDRPDYEETDEPPPDVYCPLR